MTMRVLVCGGRDFADMALLNSTLDRLHAEQPISCIIEGGASGADSLAGVWSAINNLDRHARFEADWAIHGKSAGPIRNAKMLKEGKPDLVVAFPGGSGTANMVEQVRAAGVKVLEIK